MKYTDEILHELLQKFASRDPLHKSLSEPLQGEHAVFASDNHCAVVIEGSCFKIVPAFKKNLDFYKSLKIRRNCYNEFTLNDIEAMLSNVPKMEEVRTEYAEDRCNECCGSGLVDWEYYSDNVHRYYRQKHSCPLCGGDGYFERSIEMSTGRMVTREDSTVGVKHLLFPAYAFELVADAMNLLDLQASAITALPALKQFEPMRIDLVTAQIKVYIMPKTKVEDWQAVVPSLKLI